MKRCPQCLRDYFDDTLLYCLDDGNALLEGPALADEYPTAIFPDTDAIASWPLASDTDTEMYRTVGIESIGNPNSIAVLPFVNMSPDPENEYFCDGLAEELLNGLSKIDELKVAARTSAFSFKGKNTNVSDIGRTLGVKNVLEGSVRKSGNRLRIAVQLVSASDGYHLWSERYDREMKDIFDVQDEITMAIVGVLKLRLFADQKAKILRRGTDKTGAYEFYLRGHFYLNKRTIKDLRKSAEYFTEAIAFDPNYAFAYAGLAESFVLLASYGGQDRKDAILKAKEAAFRAISIDDSLAEAQTVLSSILAEFEHDFVSAESGFKRSIELDPNTASSRHYYGQLLSQLGRHEEALAEITRALEIDPLSLVLNWIYGSSLFLARRYDDAVEQLTKVAESDPDFALAHYSLASVYMVQGEYNKCVAELVRYLEIRGDLDVANPIRESYSEQGWHGFLLATVEKGASFDSPWHNPSIFLAALGEKDNAFLELTKAYENRDSYTMLLKVDPRLDPLRTDLRFAELVEKIGFPD